MPAFSFVSKTFGSFECLFLNFNMVKNKFFEDFIVDKLLGYKTIAKTNKNM